MTEQEIKELVSRQRKYFQTGATLPVNTRAAALRKLYAAISKYEKDIHEALRKDLGKSNFESYMCETGLVLEEISYMLKHIRRFAAEKTVKTPLAQFHSHSYQKPSPYGVTLIMSPWNYPFMLTLSPLVDALAAGNTAVVKPSAYSPHTSDVIRHILTQCFDPQYVAVVTGGRAENTCLLREHFDYIFFTGSQAVGKEVMRSAAEHLTPITLELGGKSPCIVDQTANIKLAAKRIVFGKYLNCGQTCVAPDYVLVHKSVFDEFLKSFRETVRRFYGEDVRNNADYGRIVSERHMNRLKGILQRDADAIVFGGEWDDAARFLAPTVLCPKDIKSAACMQEELFGPILPVFPYDDLKDAIACINAAEKPLALYIFSEDAGEIQTILDHTSSGGVSVNDTVSHIINPELPFGGVGQSGMGNYHGEYGFLCFTHLRSVLKRSTRFRMTLAFPPFSDKKLGTIKKYMK